MQGLSLKCLLLSFASLNLMLIWIRLLTEYLNLNVPFHVGLQLSLSKRLHLLKHLSLRKVKLCQVLHRLPLKQKNKRLNHLHRFLSLLPQPWLKVCLSRLRKCLSRKCLRHRKVIPVNIFLSSGTILWTLFISKTSLCSVSLQVQKDI